MNWSKWPKNTIDVLERIVDQVECKPGWVFDLREDDDGAPRLVILCTSCVDAYKPDRRFPLSHWFPIPIATYNEASWRRWLFERCRDVETHEFGEWFRIPADDGTVERPFAPCHAPGENPYSLNEYRDPVDRETTQTGRVVPMGERDGR
jgi:hypothetical protein